MLGKHWLWEGEELDWLAFKVVDGGIVMEWIFGGGVYRVIESNYWTGYLCNTDDLRGTSVKLELARVVNVV